jgi:hypothetical protein
MEFGKDGGKVRTACKVKIKMAEVQVDVAGVLRFIPSYPVGPLPTGRPCSGLPRPFPSLLARLSNE